MDDNLRGITRPLVTMWLVGTGTIFAGVEVYFSHSTPLWFTGMVLGAVGWWFFDRYKLRQLAGKK
jgi:hypothetical protein